MRRKLATAALAGTLGLTAGALLVPAAATAADSGSTTGVAERVTAIKDALKGLVTDGTLTQSQADEVATTLAEQLPRRGPGGGPGGRGPGAGVRLSPDVLAEATGASVEELRTALREGQTLAQVAEAHDVDRAELVRRLVAAAEARLAEEVADGDLTQAQADERKAGLQERVSALVDRAGGGKGPGGRGRHGHGLDGGPGADRAEPATPSQSAPPSASPTE